MEINEKYHWNLLEEKINHLKELYGEKFEQISENLKLQAKEYERRLDSLNGEAARIKEVQKDSIPREVFDRMVSSINEKHNTEIKEIRKSLESEINTLTGKIESVEKNATERREITKKGLEEKWESTSAHIQEITSTNLKAETERFRSIDTQMKVQIDTNAEISEKGINNCLKAIGELNKWKDTITGSHAVLRNIVSAIVAIVVGIIIFYFTKK